MTTTIKFRWHNERHVTVQVGNEQPQEMTPETHDEAGLRAAVAEMKSVAELMGADIVEVTS